jgi:hypothetical protein
MRIPVALGLLAAALPPDVILPGERAVRHELVLEDGPLFSQYRFVASPSAGLGGVAQIMPGQPFSFSSKYGTKIWALPLDVPLPKDAPGRGEGARGWPTGAIEGRIPIAEVRSVPLASRVHRLITTLRVASVGAGGVELQLVAHRQLDQHGHEITRGTDLLLALVALVGLACVLRLAKRQTAAPQEAAAGQAAA